MKTLEEWTFDQKSERTVPGKIETKRGGRVGGLSASEVLSRAQALADSEGKKKGLKKEKGKYMTTDEHMARAKAELRVDKGMKEETELDESLAGQARGAEHEFAMNGAGNDLGGGSSVSKPSHAIKVGSAHFHPGKKGVGMAAQRAKALGVKPQIVKHPGGSLLGESTEESVLVEGKLPDWAQAEFDAAAKNSPAKRKVSNDDHDVARFNPKIDGKYKVGSFAKGRVHTGTYGKAVIDHDDEHPQNSPEKHPATALDTSGVDNNPMVPKVRTSVAQKAAGPQRPKGKAATPDAMAEYRKALRAHNMKKESFVYDGEQFVSLNELSKSTLGSYINKAHFDGGMADFRHGKLDGQIKTPLGLKMGRPLMNHQAEISGKRSKGIETAVKKLTKEEIDSELNEVTKTCHTVYKSHDSRGRELKNHVNVASYLSKKSANAFIHDNWDIKHPEHYYIKQEKLTLDEEVELDEKVSVSHPAFKQGYAHAKKDPVDGYANYEHDDEGATNYNAGFHKGVKDSNNAKTKKEEVEDQILLSIIKEGSMFSYEISFNDDTIYEGVGVTVSGILSESNRHMSELTESIMEKDGQIDRIKGIIKKYV